MTAWERIGIGSSERGLCLVMNRWGARRATTRFFSVISRLGDGGLWYTLIVGLALFGGVRGARAAVHMTLTGIVAATMYRFLKRWTRRPRPFHTHADITAHILPLDEFSFPSGHTLHAVSFSLVAIAWFPWLAPVLLSFTVLVAISRVVLGLHYPSDVIAATFIGVALAGGSLCTVSAGWIG